MDSFLDTCVIIHYSNYSKDSGNNSKDLTKKCFNFIQNKNGKFIICYVVLNELSNYLKKIKRTHKEVLKKLKNRDYEFSNLDLQSKLIAKKLYTKFKDEKFEKAESYLKEQREISELKIEYFLLKLLDEKVIPPEEINKKLVNKINEIISNYADCKILASALQLQAEKETFLFVTADMNDLSPNSYEYLKEYLEINSKEKYKFPKLLNLAFE